MKAVRIDQKMVGSRVVARLAGVLVFIILSSLAGFVRIPLPLSPVPVTLQTAVVLLAGLCLGGRYGALSQAGYVLLGLTGLPLFSAAGSGLLYLAGPTGGYMLGFVLAAAVAGALARRRSLGSAGVFLVLCLADAVILLCGTVWLKILTGASWPQSLAMGFVPFCAGDIVKAWCVAWVYTGLRRRIEEIF